jgi:putative oxidoreductase
LAGRFAFPSNGAPPSGYARRGAGNKTGSFREAHMEFLSRWQLESLGAFRIMTALLYTQHGANKLLGFPLREDQNWDFPEVASLRFVSGVLELFGGPLIALGLFTRPLCFLMSGHMAFAYFMGHQPDGLYPYVNGGDLSIQFCFSFLLLAAAGPGAWALDNVMFAKKAPAAAE